mmetsp:Transcript_1304/g.3271  ORF Transcript_1304/g.3271 Transcript_1304/m.3271 type:complete len:746 (+) Transcript_1304:263-2500(+)
MKLQFLAAMAGLALLQALPAHAHEVIGSAEKTMADVAAASDAEDYWNSNPNDWQNQQRHQQQEQQRQQQEQQRQQQEQQRQQGSSYRNGILDSERNNGHGSIDESFQSTTSKSSWELSHGSKMNSTKTGGNIVQLQTQSTNSTISNGFSSVDEGSEMEATKAEGKAGRLLDTAIDHDERGKTIEALRQYLQAVECYSHAIKLLCPEMLEGGRTPGGESSRQSPGLPLLTAHKERLVSLKRKRKLTLDRVDELKCRMHGNSAVTSSTPKSSAKKPTHHDSNSIQPEKLTPYEIKVLSWSSHIASGVFMPWSDNEAQTYNYSPAQPWKDPDGLLPLSDKQKDKFCQWARPSEIIAMRLRMRQKPSKIAMINSITPYTIKQYCVSDCSFIAGLCISAAFERRFNRRLVSSLIYPQDPKTGMPVYNPKGIYMVKLWLNGVERRVLVDDRLPVNARGKLLCSHTTSKGDSVLELWVPILEKAYMKLCGGYDFPGSNSGVDLFCLTGWIPERMFFPEDPLNVRDFETPVERAWERLYSANSYGDCLLTVSTSKELTEEQAERVGLFTGHAYAVLGVVETSNGMRLLQLKNPWASKGWNGRFSAQDKDSSWNDPFFCAEVGCNAAAVSYYDDGVFWMPWKDVILYFRNIHMSWSTDPDLFRFRTAVHGYWGKDMGPNDDSYNVGENPQYTITLSDRAIERAKHSQVTLWLLLVTLKACDKAGAGRWRGESSSWATFFFLRLLTLMRRFTCIA